MQRILAGLIAFCLSVCLCLPAQTQSLSPLQILVQAGETIQPLHAVVCNNGFAYNADPTNAAHSGKVIGISVNNAVAGSTAMVQMAGEVYAVGLNANTKYYVGAGGALVTAPPGGAVWNQIIGYARSSTLFELLNTGPIGAAGTVTSVGMTGDGVLFNSVVSGSPITNAGTLAPTQKTQPNNTWFGNVSGGVAAPIFNTTGLPVVIGGTGATALTGNGAVVMNAGGTAQTTVAPSTSGNLMTSNGSSWASTAPVATASTSADISADVTMTTANTIYDGPSITLGAGTWLIIGVVSVRVAGASGGSVTCYVRDATPTYYAQTGIWAGVNGAQTTGTMGVIVSPGSSTTYKLSATANVASCTLCKTTFANDQGIPSTRIIAIRLY